MSSAKTKERSGCPIDFGLDIFGDRWTLLVIRDLLFVGKRHFNELMQSPERIASNILAARLKKLEERGLISRAPDPDNRKQVVYELTEMGRDLTPVLVELVRWGGKYDPDTPVPKSVVKRLSRDNDALLREMREAMAAAGKSGRRRA
jgi:DNA-binding HxlR family transcriptional regulator